MKNKIGTFIFQTLIPLALTAVFVFMVYSFKHDTEKHELFAYVMFIGLAISFFFLTIGSLRYYSPAFDSKKDMGSIFTGLAICGITISLGAGFSLLSINEIDNYYHSKKTKANIYNIEVKTEEVKEKDDDGYEYTKLVKKCDYDIVYKVNNEQMHGKIEGSKCNKDINDTIKIYYNVNDPSIIRESYMFWIYILCFVIGFPCAIIGVYMTYKTLKPKKRRRR